MELVNKSPFAAGTTVLHDKEGRDFLVVIAKCTYGINGGSYLQVAEEQVPVRMADEYYGKPGESSVRYESDLVPIKLSTDIVLTGHAYAPEGAARELDVTVKVGPVVKTCRVYGNRHWAKSFGSLKISNPEPFKKMPLMYERSFGGADLSAPDEKSHERESRNPVGCGLMSGKSKLNPKDVSLPNIEDPAILIKSIKDRPKPAGFGFIGRHWQPRLSFAGTYDSDWVEKRSPMVPVDFDERHYNGAHPDLIAEGYLSGGEPVEIINASRAGNLRFTLPQDQPNMAMISKTYEWTHLEPRLDTVIIEPDESRVTVVWRSSMNIHKRLHTVGAVRVAADA